MHSRHSGNCYFDWYMHGPTRVCFVWISDVACSLKHLFFMFHKMCYSNGVDLIMLKIHILDLHSRVMLFLTSL